MAAMTLRVEGSTALFRMLESLEKLESLDVKIVYPGHGQPFKKNKKGQANNDGVLKSHNYVMPDLIRYPETFEITGFRLSPE